MADDLRHASRETSHRQREQEQTQENRRAEGRRWWILRNGVLDGRLFKDGGQAPQETAEKRKTDSTVGEQLAQRLKRTPTSFVVDEIGAQDEHDYAKTPAP